MSGRPHSNLMDAVVYLCPEANCFYYAKSVEAIRQHYICCSQSGADEMACIDDMLNNNRENRTIIEFQDIQLLRDAKVNGNTDGLVGKNSNTLNTIKSTGAMREGVEESEDSSSSSSWEGFQFIKTIDESVGRIIPKVPRPAYRPPASLLFGPPPSKENNRPDDSIKKTGQCSFSIDQLLSKQSNPTINQEQQQQQQRPPQSRTFDPHSNYNKSTINPYSNVSQAIKGGHYKVNNYKQQKANETIAKLESECRRIENEMLKSQQEHKEQMQYVYKEKTSSENMTPKELEELQIKFDLALREIEILGLNRSFRWRYRELQEKQRLSMDLKKRRRLSLA